MMQSENHSFMQGRVCCSLCATETHQSYSNLHSSGKNLVSAVMMGSEVKSFLQVTFNYLAYLSGGRIIAD